MNQFQLHFVTDKQLIRIIKILDQFQLGKVRSAAELSEFTGASHRTILSDIKEIKDYFKASIVLDSSNLGYTFRIKNKQKYIEQKRYLSKNEPLFRIIESIFFSEVYSLDQWSEKLHSTSASLARYIDRIKPILTKYQLYMSTKQVDLIGEELNKRQFFHDFFYESDITSHSVIPSIEAQEIAISLTKEHFFQEYVKTSFFDFNYVIFITLERFKKGNFITEFSKDKAFMKHALIKHMKTVNLVHVREMIMKFYNVELTDEERTYIYLLLISRRSISSVSSEKLFIDRFNNWPDTINLADKFIDLFEISFDKKRDSRILFQSFFVNLFLKHTISPVLTQNLSTVSYHANETFPILYETCLEFIDQEVSPILKLTLEQVHDISADLALYTDAINNKYWFRKRNILILLEGNQFIVESIQTRISKYFENHHKLFFPDITDLDNLYFKNMHYDIVITNYIEFVEQFAIEIPYILFEPIPTTSNWKDLFKLLDSDLAKILF